MYKLKQPIKAKKFNKVEIITDHEGNEVAINLTFCRVTFSNGFTFELSEEQFKDMFLEM